MIIIIIIINNDTNKMAARLPSRSRSHSRCCSCMKNGKCIRCQCVKKGLFCVDCWPSLSNPSCCENSRDVTVREALPRVPIARASENQHQDSVFHSSSDPLPSDVASDLSADSHGNSAPSAARGDFSDEIQQTKSFLCHPMKVLKRIPRLSRTTTAEKLAFVIEQVITSNDIPCWLRLLQFTKKCLFSPQRGGKRWNLASLVNKQVSQEHLNLEASSNNHTNSYMSRPSSKSRNPLENLAARVSSKLEEGNYKGAVRLASSEDVMAEHTNDILEALRQKYPPPHADSSIADFDCRTPLQVPIDTELIRNAITSFPNGSGGGPGGLLPQHLKDLTGPSAGDGGVLLLKALTSLICLMLEGRTPKAIRPLLFGANLIALRKKGGGVRPIAIGNTIRRLASKCACLHALKSCPDILAPHQLGFGVPGVHASRIYLNHLPPNKAIY